MVANRSTELPYPHQKQMVSTSTVKETKAAPYTQQANRKSRGNGVDSKGRNQVHECWQYWELLSTELLVLERNNQSQKYMMEICFIFSGLRKQRNALKLKWSLEQPASKLTQKAISYHGPGTGAASTNERHRAGRLKDTTKWMKLVSAILDRLLLRKWNCKKLDTPI